METLPIFSPLKASRPPFTTAFLLGLSQPTSTLPPLTVMSPGESSPEINIPGTAGVNGPVDGEATLDSAIICVEHLLSGIVAEVDGDGISGKNVTSDDAFSCELTASLHVDRAGSLDGMTAVSGGGSALFGVERAAAFHSDGSCYNAAAAVTIIFLVGGTAREP